jgi:DnaJ-class molecular chaperone
MIFNFYDSHQEKQEHQGFTKCPACNGKGYFFFPQYSPLPGKCEDCNGTGYVRKGD